MKYFAIKNWDQFQQYKDRDPKWIKLHRDVLDDYEFDGLTEIQQCHLFKIWLLAAKLGNKIPSDPKWVGKRIGAQSKVDLDAMQSAGFLVPSDKPKKVKPEGFVYFMRAEETRRIKIGFSSRLRFRVSEVRRVEGEEITLMGAFPGDRSDENKLHDKFESLSLGNEWFTYDDDIVYTCVQMCSGHAYIEEETEEETETEGESARVRHAPSALPKPEFLSKQVWNDYRSFRTSKRAKLTPTAWTKIQNELERGIAHGHDPNDMLGEAMVAGWTGFKCEWYENRINGNSKRSDGSADGWSDVLQIITKSRGDQRAWLEKNPEYRAAIQSIGGLKQLGMMNDFQLKDARQRFADALAERRAA